MNIKFLGQGLGNTENTVADILLKSFLNKKFNKFSCFVAFASFAGVEGLSETIKKSKDHIKEFNIFIGIDQRGTSKEALEALLNLDINTKIYYTVSHIIFHPKIYIFEGEKICRIIVGSANLTQPGLFQNIEGSLMIDCDNPPEFKEICLKNQILKYFKMFFNTTNNNIKSLDSELLKYLINIELVPEDSERKTIHETKKLSEEDESNKQIIQIKERFPPIKIAKPPDDFKIKKQKNQQVSTSIKSITPLQIGRLLWKK